MGKTRTAPRKAAPETSLVLAGGARRRMRKASKRDWNRGREEAYVNALAETCNLTLAAAAAGVSVSSARERRKSNALFRASCAEAVGHGYHRLEVAFPQGRIGRAGSRISNRGRADAASDAP